MIPELLTVALLLPGGSRLAPTLHAPDLTEQEIRIPTEGIAPPQKTKHVNPTFPPNALRAGLVGSVVLECTIDTRGKVKNIKVVDGYPVLAQAAMKAVRHWEFRPAVRDGVAVPVVATIRSNFSLTGTLRLKDVLRAASDKDRDIRVAAVRWLGTNRPVTDQQRKAIQRLLADRDSEVRAAAASAMETLAAPDPQAHELDAAFRSDIEALLEATHATELSQQFLSIFVRQFLAQAETTHRDVTDAVVDRISQSVAAEVGRMFSGPNGMLPTLVEIYGRHLTPADVKDLLAFYRSDVGRKTVTVLPLIMQEAALAGQQWATEHAAEIQAAVESRLRADGIIK